VARVYVFMGSDSDLPVMAGCLEALERFGVEYEVHISSAHRVPEKTAEMAQNAASRGVEVIVAGAGSAAHLAGVIASHTPLPVIAVPFSGSALQGVDALYASVQMPRGVPVATVAIDGAFNAGILAVQILGLKDGQLGEKMAAYKEELSRQVQEKDARLQEVGYKQYLEEKGKNSRK